jgi:pyruvate/2-oxoacid:ferredoxin oxidoreductase alpha subunit
MSRVELLTGNEAAARAVRMSKPQVIPTYPITPQSPMLEIIARDVETGLLNAEFVNMESDYAVGLLRVRTYRPFPAEAIRAVQTVRS